MSLATLTAVKQVHNQFLLDEFLYISAAREQNSPRIISKENVQVG